MPFTLSPDPEPKWPMTSSPRCLRPTSPRSTDGSPTRSTHAGGRSSASDTYDWDYSEHLTVPNPDYGSAANSAVTPKSDRVVVFHRNAKRFEDAGLAAPYRFRTKPWSITQAALLAPAELDPARPLTP